MILVGIREEQAGVEDLPRWQLHCDDEGQLRWFQLNRVAVDSENFVVVDLNLPHIVYISGGKGLELRPVGLEGQQVVLEVLELVVSKVNVNLILAKDVSGMWEESSVGLVEPQDSVLPALQGSHRVDLELAVPLLVQCDQKVNVQCDRQVH